MNVLVLGSGGREHALCHAISKSPLCNELYAIPGNPGISTFAKCISLNPLDNKEIFEFANNNNINLIIPGSEVYLQNGIADTFKDTDTKVFGPTIKASRIESSKEFAKDLMDKYDIPTAEYESFNNYDKALQYIQKEGTPIVIKYDGLAGGKGVVVALTFEEAKAALHLMLVEKKYGNEKVIIEEFLEGPEYSLMCFVNEETIIPMPIAQDHKRLLDNDLGPNTGGMGIYCPVPTISEDIVKQSMNDIMIPTIKAMVKENSSFTGFLYGGLMLTKNGPKVIEFNSRFGDPEAEVILPKLKSDILLIINTIMDNRKIDISWDNKFITGVVLASKGYPNGYKTDFKFEGVNDTTSIVYHMGTKIENEQLLTNGGRVLLVTGTGDDLGNSIKDAYSNVEKIKCQNLIYRNDIGNKSVKR